MKEFRCGDVVPGCSASFEGPSEDAVARDVAEHARRDHGLEPTEELLDVVRSRTRTT